MPKKEVRKFAVCGRRVQGCFCDQGGEGRHETLGALDDAVEESKAALALAIKVGRSDMRL